MAYHCCSSLLCMYIIRIPSLYRVGHGGIHRSSLLPLRSRFPATSLMLESQDELQQVAAPTPWGHEIATTDMFYSVSHQTAHKVRC